MRKCREVQNGPITENAVLPQITLFFLKLSYKYRESRINS